MKNKVIVPYSKWLSFDHSNNLGDNTVIKADTTNLSAYVADESLDVAIYSLSLWGVNKIDYYKEAYRMLKKGGIMYVAEPTDKIDQKLYFAAAIEIGFEIASDGYEPHNMFTYFTYIKK